MHKLLNLGSLVIALMLVSCAKDAQEIAQDVGLIPSTCGSDGARLQATVGGSSYCANAQILATGDGSSVIITGIDLTGNTLVLQLDSLTTGEQVMNEASNSILFMQTGTTYTIAPHVEGSLQILLVDTLSRRLKATFQAPVRNAINGLSKQLEGEVDVMYTTGG